MDKRLKQRLIGAAVLVALAVIFLPMLLTGPVERQALDVPIEVPPRPQITATPTAPEPLAEIEVPSRARPVATSEPPPVAESESPAASPSSVAEESVPGPAPVVEAESAPEPVPVDEALAAWAVQVGSFGSQVNAMGLRDRLREQGYSAYVESASEQSRFYRVRVGPVIDRTEARALQQRLESELDTATLIVSHP